MLVRVIKVMVCLDVVTENWWIEAPIKLALWRSMDAFHPGEETYRY